MHQPFSLKTVTGFIPFAGLVIGSCSSDPDNTLQNKKSNVLMIMFDDPEWDNLVVQSNTFADPPTGIIWFFQLLNAATFMFILFVRSLLLHKPKHITIARYPIHRKEYLSLKRKKPDRVLHCPRN